MRVKYNPVVHSRDVLKQATSENRLRPPPTDLILGYEISQDLIRKEECAPDSHEGSSLNLEDEVKALGKP